MAGISSEALKAGMPGPDKPIEAMTEEELKAFRLTFEPDSMGFDGTEGIDDEGGAGDGSK